MLTTQSKIEGRSMGLYLMKSRSFRPFQSSRGFKRFEQLEHFEANPQEAYSATYTRGGFAMNNPR